MEFLKFISFYSAQSALVSSLPEDAPELFRAYPEFYLEDLLNLYTYDIKWGLFDNLEISSCEK